jgi:hypothetical protein
VLDLCSIQWRAIMAACLISLFVTTLIGVGFGMIGATLAMFRGPHTFDGLNFQADSVQIAGFALSLLPKATAGLYLAHVVERNLLRHCVVFGAITLALAVLSSLGSEELAMSWRAVAYHLSIIPAVLCGGVIGDRLSDD